MSENTIQLFKHEDWQIRVISLDGEPWFVARDVTDALSLDRTMTRRLDDDEKDVHTMHTPGGDQQFSIVSESGLYSLVLRSRKPEAHEFRRWVTHEVLPTIRRTCEYRVTCKEVERPPHREVIHDDTWSVGDLAHYLTDHGGPCSRNGLFRALRESGYLLGGTGETRNTPTPWSRARGYFVVRERRAVFDGGTKSVVYQTRLTPEGVEYFLDGGNGE